MRDITKMIGGDAVTQPYTAADFLAGMAKRTDVNPNTCCACAYCDDCAPGRGRCVCEIVCRAAERVGLMRRTGERMWEVSDD